MFVLAKDDDEKKQKEPQNKKPKRKSRKRKTKTKNQELGSTRKCAERDARRKDIVEKINKINKEAPNNVFHDKNIDYKLAKLRLDSDRKQLTGDDVWMKMNKPTALCFLWLLLGYLVM